MRILKRIGVSLAVIGVVLCAVGASSAFAEDSEVVFCKKLQALCEATAIWPAGTEIKLLSENQRFLGSPEVKCEHAQMNGKTVQSMAELFEVEMTSGKFSGCGVCEAADAEGFPRRYTIWMPGPGYAINFSVKLTLLGCGALKFSCQYGGELTGIPAENTETAPVVSVSGATLPFLGGTGGTAFCGKSTSWDGSWTLTTPSGPIWFSLFQL